MERPYVLFLTALMSLGYSPPAFAECIKAIEIEKVVANSDALTNNGLTNPQFSRIRIKLRTCDVIFTCETKKDRPPPIFLSQSKTLTVWLKVRFVL